ncbi:hypothetical protein JTB14_031145 [Gonioctena quinquepunctata]|nr:hypothetical protein JTB14_031145 [Gonioctena quinquepunctata]
MLGKRIGKDRRRQKSKEMAGERNPARGNTKPRWQQRKGHRTTHHKLQNARNDVAAQADEESINKERNRVQGGKN